jgi:four helix bundle protein
MGEYKFQSLVVYQLSLDYHDQVYEILEILPDNERFNLCSQIARAATSITLNIAEGSTGQSNKEQARFLGMAIRSYIETVACLDLIERRGYIPIIDLSRVRRSGRTLFYKITRFKNALRQ